MSGQHPHKALYNTAAWKARRAAQLRLHPLCAMCYARGIVRPATVADHVTPHRGDLTLFHAGDLQSLCASCHSGAKQAEEHGRGLRGGDTQGVPLDPRHHWNRGGHQPTEDLPEGVSINPPPRQP